MLINFSEDSAVQRPYNQMVITSTMPATLNTSELNVQNLTIEPSSVSSNSKQTDDGSHVTSGMYSYSMESIEYV